MRVPCDLETPDLYPQLLFEGVPEPLKPVTITATGGAARCAARREPLTSRLRRSWRAAYRHHVDPYALEPGVDHVLTLRATDAEGGTREIECVRP